jgi:hypothetical protein
MSNNETLSIEICCIKVPNVGKGETSSLSMSRDVVISLHEVQFGDESIIGEKTEHPCILAKDLIQIVFRELSDKAIKDESTSAIQTQVNMNPVSQSKTSYIDVSICS